MKTTNAQYKTVDGGTSTPTDIVTHTFIREVTAKYIGPRRKCGRILCPKDVKDFAAKVVRDNSREHFLALFLNGAHHVVSFSVVTTGTANSTLVHPREIFQHAVLVGATAIVVAHNHPSSQLEASGEDVRVTHMLKAAGEIMGIELLDHVIFTDDGHWSFKDNGTVF